MLRKVNIALGLFVLLNLSLLTVGHCAPGPAVTDPKQAGPDFEVQGEYTGEITNGEKEKWGAQVIALGEGKFRLVGYQGGLPGDGWSRGDKRVAADGETDGDVTTFTADDWTATIKGGELTVVEGDNTLGTLKKVMRKSETLGAEPPEEAIVLFDGSSVDGWENGKLVEGKYLAASGTTSKETMGDHTMHLEFRTPFMPAARGQGRGNSGVYVQSRYEVQVLDSFGLEGKDNECGGIYQISEPKVNMCYPPLSWQTYDIEFTDAKYEDGKKVEAEIVGRDPETDVALIRVETEETLPFLPLGDSDGVRPGDWVVAIGNPFGLEHTITAGIVSAKHRRINPEPGARRFDDFIQTDAAINPGNSGGPLLNLAGEVIGINTAINPRANTIGFAVPVNLAKSILPQLRATGHVSRGWLGVYIQAIDEDTADLLELESEQGALVSKVEPGSPADRAGIQRGDVIVSFGGREIEEMETLPRVVATTAVGSEVDVTVLRKGDRKTLEVTLGELGGDVAKAQDEGTPQTSAFGLQVQELTPDIAEQLGLEAAEGVVITGVKSGSPAEEAGLRRGDVVLEVNQQAVDGVDAFRDALAGKSKGALLLVRRGEAEIFVPLKSETS